MISIKCDPTKPNEMFNDLVSDDIQREIPKAFLEQYKRSCEYCYGTFAKTEAHDLLPEYRRACIEGIMPDLAERIGGYTIDSRKNKAGNCWHRLILSDSIILTQSKVEQREILPRDAEFRKGYAKSNQMLFDFMNENEASELDAEAPLYAIIVHKPADDDKRLPEFIDIVFPDKNYKEIVGRIRLLDKFPDIISIPEINQETIPDNVEIKVERSTKKFDSEIA
jgi:hypothetical protein